MKLKGVVLAAGSGQRLQPLTHTRPKPLVPIVGRTLLQRNLDKMIMAGIDEIIIVVPKNTTQQLSAFLQNYPNAQLHFIEQEQALGTAHAVDMVKSQVSDSNFLMVYGDNITAYDYSQLINRHALNNATATMALRRVENPSKHGVVEIHEEKVIGIIEKPENPTSDLVFSGMCVFTPHIFEAISHTKKSPRGEYYLTDSIQLLIEWGHTIGYATLDTWRLNVNDHQDLLQASQLLLSEEYSDNYVQSHAIEHSSKFQIIPPVFIGEYVRIGRNTIIGPYVTLEHAACIGENTRIQNSILLSRASIGNNCVIANSILGEGARVEDNFHTSKYKSVALVLGDGKTAFL